MSLQTAFQSTAEAFGSKPVSPFIEGTISEDVARVEDMARVISDAFGSGLQFFGPAPWPERADGVLPQAGDPCLFVRSNVGRTWVIAWWPYGGE